MREVRELIGDRLTQIDSKVYDEKAQLRNANDMASNHKRALELLDEERTRLVTYLEEMEAK